MKSFAAIAALAGLATSAVAAPLLQRNINDNGTAAFAVGDANVLNFALILEYLELNLYETVVTTYSNQDFINSGFTAADRDTFLQIIVQEQNHIANLQNNVRMLGSAVIQPCKYNYGTVTSLKQLLNATDAVNALGPCAYVGAGAFVSSKLVLTEGAAIGNVESRHNSWLNGLLGRSEQPNPYQTPLSPTQAYGIGSAFIVDGSCPAGNQALMGAILAYPPALQVTNAGYPAAPLQNGQTIYLKSPSGKTAPRVAFVYGLQTTIVDFDQSSGSAVIPSDATGFVVAVLTTAVSGQVLDNVNSITAPAPFYVDSPAQNFANVKVTTYDF